MKPLPLAMRVPQNGVLDRLLMALATLFWILVPSLLFFGLIALADLHDRTFR
jgi:hypothetical protein